MHWWQQENVLAGKDLQAGGTWLGLNQQKKFSALTNFRQPHLLDKNKQSRGDLVLQALKLSSRKMSEKLANSNGIYNGFNLVFGALDNLQCFDSVNSLQQPLTTGFHSLCNGALDDIWPKMALGQQQLAQAIQTTPAKKGTPALDIDKLFDLMQNSQQAHIEHLPDTGLPLDWEQLLSSIFIVSPEYGTRTTNIITLDNNGCVSVYDRSYNEQGQCQQQQNFTIA